MFRYSALVFIVHAVTLSVRWAIQGDSRGNVNVLEGDIISYCEKRNLHVRVFNSKSWPRSSCLNNKTKFVKFFVVGLDEEKTSQIELNTPEEFLACILDTAVCTKKCQYHLRPKVRDLCTRAA